MKPRKKSDSLLDQLSKPLRAFVADFNENGPQSLEDLRRENNAKYVEQSVKLIALIAQLNPSAADKEKTPEEEGAALLKAVDMQEELITGERAQQALEAKEAFVDTLQAIRDRALGLIQ